MGLGQCALHERFAEGCDLRDVTRASGLGEQGGEVEARGDVAGGVRGAEGQGAASEEVEGREDRVLVVGGGEDDGEEAQQEERAHRGPRRRAWPAGRAPVTGAPAARVMACCRCQHVYLHSHLDSSDVPRGGLAWSRSVQCGQRDLEKGSCCSVGAKLDCHACSSSRSVAAGVCSAWLVRMLPHAQGISER